MRRCPECWSAVEADEASCPQCGARLAAAPRRRGLVFGFAALAALAAAVAWQLGRGSPTDETPEIEVEAEDRAPTAVSAGDEVARPAALHHWRLRRVVDDQAVPAVALASPSPGRGLLLLAADAIPLDDGLAHGGSVLAVEVLTIDPAGWALLLTPEPPPEVEPLELAPARARPAGTVLVPATRTGERLDAVALAAPATERLVLDRDVPADAVLLDERGALVGLARGGRVAIAVGGALLWRDQRVGRALAEAQDELRRDDPRWLLESVARGLVGDAARPIGAEVAIERCRRAVTLARDRETVEIAQEWLKLALALRVRELATRDPMAGIATARDALAEFPGDPTLESELATLVDELRSGAAEALRVGQHADAARTLARLVEAFPRRADLRHDLAQCLIPSDPGAALAQLREAAALDPSFAEAAARLAQRLERNEVVIPFDPRTHAIDASVSVAGVDVAFVVDTGASLTTIPAAVADRLGLRSPGNRRVTVQTASGTAEGEVVSVPWIRIGSIREEAIEAVVIDLPGALAGRGLLGMNFLQRLDVQIDGENGRLTLRSGR